MIRRNEPKVGIVFKVGRLSTLVAQIQADEDKHGTKEEVDGDGLWEDEPGKKDGGDGIEIDIVCYDDGSKFLHCPVPCQEAECGGYTA